jgi:hypothetical protein
MVRSGKSVLFEELITAIIAFYDASTGLAVYQQPTVQLQTISANMKSCVGLRWGRCSPPGCTRYVRITVRFLQSKRVA